MIGSRSYTQVTLGIQDFEASPATPTMTYINSGSVGATITGSSGAGDRPATSPFFVSSNTGWQATNGTSTMTFTNTTGLASYTGKYFEFKLAAFSIASTGNGMEQTDLTSVEISLDGGTTWSKELTIGGNSGANSFWTFAATGTATQTYDGDNTPTAFNAASSGSNAAGHSTVRVNLPDASTQARIRIILFNNAAAERWVIDDVKLVGTLTAGCTATTEPTIASSAVTVTPTSSTATVNFTRGNGAGVIAVVSTDCTITAPTDHTVYSSSSSYGSANVTAAGDYIVYIGTANSFNITGLSTGTNYCVQIFEYNGTSTCVEYMSTGGSQSFTTGTASVKPHLTGVMINACEGSCQEGDNELVFGTTADYSLLVNTTNLVFKYDNSSPASITYTDALTTVPSTTSALNTAAGCAGLFLEGTGATMPPGSKFLIVKNTMCISAHDWTSLCGSGPIYIIYTTDANWISAGNFVNSSSGLRYFRTTFTTTDANTNTIDYSFNSNSLSLHANGDYVGFGTNGGAAILYENNGCTIDPTILPVTWGEFRVKSKKNTAILDWNTLTERNNAYFDIEMADESGTNFVKVGQVKGAGSTSERQDYHFEIEDLTPGYYYFRLRQVDYNGMWNFSDIRGTAITGNDVTIYPNPNQGQFVIQGYEEGARFEVYNKLGSVIYSLDSDEFSSKIDLSAYADGIYFVRVISATASETFKVEVIK